MKLTKPTESSRHPSKEWQIEKDPLKLAANNTGTTNKPSRKDKKDTHNVENGTGTKGKIFGRPADNSKKTSGDGSLVSYGEYTRKRNTHREYVWRGNELAEEYFRFKNMVGYPLDCINPIELARYVLEKHPHQNTASWGKRKAYARTFLEAHPHCDSEYAIRLLTGEIVDHHENVGIGLSNSASEMEIVKSKRTSGEKGIPKEDFDKIIHYLNLISTSIYRLILRDWIIASNATGLRPGEWHGITVKVTRDQNSSTGRRIILIVKNGKTTNNRGNGPIRKLDISNLRPDTLEAVFRMCERCAKYTEEGTFSHVKKSCEKFLNATCKRIFKNKKTGKYKLYNLKSMRHQFAANMKSIKSEEEIASLMGHRSLKSAESYASKKDAWSRTDIPKITIWNDKGPKVVNQFNRSKK